MNYINYEEETIEPKEKWSPKVLVNHWRKLYVKHHRGSVMWGLKETTLLSRLLKVYPAKDLADMMELWFTTTSSSAAFNFSSFYSKVPELHSKLNKEREWKWS